MSKMILFATNPEDIKMISNLSTLERRSTRDSATSMVGSDDLPSEKNSPTRLVGGTRSNSADSKRSTKKEESARDSEVYCTRCKLTHAATESCQEKEETESVQHASPTLQKKSSTRVNEEVEGRMMMLDKPMGSFARAFLNFLTFIAELLLVGILAVTLFWVFHYEGGVAWKNDVKRQFNLHFILMVGGFIFLNGQAILAYRLFGCVRRIYAKLIHAFILIAAAGCIAVGFYMAYEANDRVPKAMHFYSLHSWLAIGTCGLFAMQFVVGFMSFLVLLCCDGATSSFRAALVPVHATFGLVIFSMASATAVTGLMQAARARLNGQNANPDYREFPEQGLIINAVAAAIILLVILIPLITRNNIRGGRAVFASE